jgi:hypothetical protein
VSCVELARERDHGIALARNVFLESQWIPAFAGMTSMCTALI